MGAFCTASTSPRDAARAAAPGEHERGVRRPRGAPAARDVLGSRQPHRAAGCYDEGKRCAEALMVDYHRQLARRRAHRAHLQHLRPAHVLRRRPRGEQLHPPGPARRRPHALRRRHGRRARFCYVDDLVDGLHRAHGARRPRRAGEPRQPRGVHHARPRGRGACALVGGPSARPYRPLPQDDPRQRQPDIARAEPLLGFAPRVPPARRACGRTIDDLRRRLVAQG
jgi:UDP-glucuronate decarboxylase